MPGMKYGFILFFFLVAGLAAMNPRFHLVQKELISPNPSDNLPVSPALPIAWEDLSQKGKKYDPIIKAAALQYAIDPLLIKAIIHVESRFDHRAVSPRGAVGLMQIRPGIASSQGDRDPFNPKENIYAGVGHFRSLLDYFEGDRHLALAAYNAGVSRVLIYEGVPPFPETRDYIQKVLFGFQFYSQQKRGIHDGLKSHRSEQVVGAGRYRTLAIAR
ncbi:MAG: lytic transglycosylase domain-containing protein [Pseudomonadota bacterium]